MKWPGFIEASCFSEVAHCQEVSKKSIKTVRMFLDVVKHD